VFQILYILKDLFNNYLILNKYYLRFLNYANLFKIPKFCRLEQFVAYLKKFQYTSLVT
jgi:hypothetical protein